MNARWNAGAVLQAPWAGVTVTVPPTFQAEASADGRSRLMGGWAVPRGTGEQPANGAGYRAEAAPC